MTLQSLLSNFALILFVLMVVTGIIWFLDKFYLARQRQANADRALAEFDARKAALVSQGVQPDTDTALRASIRDGLLKQPVWIEYSGSFFPVIALVFFLRSFLYEPFKIPSSSMVPTLMVGDLILVNKFDYCIRLPIINKKIIEIGSPQRGDVMVFRFPKDETQDYIKRVVGVPGDKIVYKNKKLTVNGQTLSYQALPDFLDDESLNYMSQLEENLGGVEHKILNNPRAPSYVPNPDNFPNRELCSYDVEGFSCTVPQGQYFMMGDNRDNSLDSRYWGFVPDKNIVGKAFFVWMNFGDLKRIGAFH
jgi:signal peptidase I